jgi:mono/diheme cytochrome c family protein
VIPPLAGNPAVIAAQPNNIIKVIIRGITARNGYIPMPSFSSSLNDQEIVEITNYIRSNWGNTANPDATKALVEDIRKHPGI